MSLHYLLPILLHYTACSRRFVFKNDISFHRGNHQSFVFDFIKTFSRREQAPALRHTVFLCNNGFGLLPDLARWTASRYACHRCKRLPQMQAIEISRLNELLLLFTENRIIEFVADNLQRIEDTRFVVIAVLLLTWH